MKELVTRFNLASPTFFVKIQKLGVLLSALSVILLGLQAQMPTIEVPALVYKVAEYLAVAGGVAATIAKLTVADPTQIQK
jgi:hypothetical protein